jgi:3-deoxy-D-manno-octulosonate 8-phosphate phosphatase KdsC-like HAD superfamily phosphatase
LSCIRPRPVSLLAVDFDGTLAAGDEVDRASLAALREFPGTVVLATGRGRNGAEAVSLRGTWRRNAPPLPALAIDRFAAVAEDEGCSFRRHVADGGSEVISVEVASPTDRVHAVVRGLALVHPSLSVTGSIDAYGTPLLSIAQATKGSGLLALLAHLGIGTHATLAIADGENDEPLAVARTLVAVGSAHESLLRVATHRADMGPGDRAVARVLGWLDGEEQPVRCLPPRGCARLAEYGYWHGNAVGCQRGESDPSIQPLMPPSVELRMVRHPRAHLVPPPGDDPFAGPLRPF